MPTFSAPASVPKPHASVRLIPDTKPVPQHPLSRPVSQTFFSESWVREGLSSTPLLVAQPPKSFVVPPVSLPPLKTQAEGQSRCEQVAAGSRAAFTSPARSDALCSQFPLCRGRDHRDDVGNMHAGARPAVGIPHVQGWGEGAHPGARRAHDRSRAVMGDTGCGGSPEALLI